MSAPGGDVSAEVSDRALRELAEGAWAAGRFALDTEFMGEGRYRTLLCLVQLATPQVPGMAERIELLDPLEEGLTAAPLSAVLADPRVEVVVHAGRQDVALVRRRFGSEVRNVFDTQVAAGFAGLGAQTSYESLLAELLGVRIAKTAGFTRWDTRPLTAEQRAYAREDVVHLLELADELQRRLLELGRLEWARPGWKVGGSFWYGGTANADSVLGTGSFAAPMTLLSADVRYDVGGASFRGEVANINVSDAGAIDARYGTTVGSRISGGYVEGAYDLLRLLAPGASQRLNAFVRHERYDTQASVPAGVTRDRSLARRRTTFGLTYKPTWNTAFKGDYQLVRNAAGVGEHEVLSLGIGYQF